MLSPTSYTAMLCPLDASHDTHYHTYADYNRHMLAHHAEDAIESVLFGDPRQVGTDIERGIHMIADAIRANLLSYTDDPAHLTMIAEKIGAAVIDAALADPEEGR